MSYEPTVWKDGDLVTSAKLNKMEQGIARQDIVEGMQEGNIMTLNKTWQEIWDNNYTNIVFIHSSSAKTFVPIQELSLNNGTYSVSMVAAGKNRTFTCDSPDAYPSYDTSGEEAHDGIK